MASLGVEDCVARKHIALLPFPITGRIVPFMGLAKKLAAQGCSVSFIYFPAHRRPQVENAYESRAGKHPLISLVPLETSSDPAKAATNRLHDTMSSVISIFDLVKHGSLGDALEELLEQMQPSCFISCEVVLTYLGSFVKKTPHCVLFPMPAMVLSLLFHVAKDMDRLGRLTPETINLDLPVIGQYPVQGGEHNMVSVLTTSKANFYNDCVPKLHHVSACLVNSFPQAEPLAFEALESSAVNPNKVPIVDIGPLVPHEIFTTSFGQETHHEFHYFLSTQKPASVVYISFGSMGLPTTEQLQELAKGLEASEQPFLWIVNSNEAHELLPTGFLKRTGHLGMVSNSWVPQLDILTHPAIGAYLTHCGWNSSIEAMTVGIPVLTKPYMVDQYTNAWTLVEQLGMGVQLSKDGITDSKRVEEGIRLIFGDSDQGISIRERAKLAKAAALEAWNSADKNLKSLIDKLTM